MPPFGHALQRAGEGVGASVVNTTAAEASSQSTIRRSLTCLHCALCCSCLCLCLCAWPHMVLPYGVTRQSPNLLVLDLSTGAPGEGAAAAGPGARGRCDARPHPQRREPHGGASGGCDRNAAQCVAGGGGAQHGEQCSEPLLPTYGGTEWGCTKASAWTCPALAQEPFSTCCRTPRCIGMRGRATQCNALHSTLPAAGVAPTGI